MSLVGIELGWKRVWLEVNLVALLYLCERIQLMIGYRWPHITGPAGTSLLDNV